MRTSRNHIDDHQSMTDAIPFVSMEFERAQSFGGTEQLFTRLLHEWTGSPYPMQIKTRRLRATWEPALPRNQRNNDV